MQRGVRISAWCLLLVAVIGILSKCASLHDLERLARRRHTTHRGPWRRIVRNRQPRQQAVQGHSPVHHQSAHHPRSIATADERAKEVGKLALDPKHPAPGRPSPLPRQCRRPDATLRTAAMNLLRLTGFASIREGLQAVMHDIRALLALARRKPVASP